MPERLSDGDVDSKLAGLPGWSRQDNHIEKNFKFKDFAGALEFVNRVGAEAQKMDHHPDLLLHNWNQVKITVTTHSAKGITANDFELANKASQAESA